MLRVKFVRSRNDPLRIAAFFFNKLKRVEVLDTNISSTVVLEIDKILQDEVNLVSYGVLGYLLLGIVRIYSEKVEYILKDCELFAKINKFVINTVDIARVETFRMPITIPDRLELDAFELDLPEDDAGAHIAAPEEITLTEVASRTGGFGLLSHQTFTIVISPFHTNKGHGYFELFFILLDFENLSVLANVLSFGASRPESMLIATPATRERSLYARKRKVVLDRRIVLANEALKERIHNANDLVSDRRKFHRTVHTVQRESSISSLPNRLYEPLHPCSSKLQVLFSRKEMKIPDSLRIVETLGNLDVSECHTVGSPEPIATILPTPSHYPDASESHDFGNPEDIATSSTHESIEMEQSLEGNEVLNLSNEEINSRLPENSELYGWSRHTRKVASYLQQSFVHPKEQREEDNAQDIVNFSQVFGDQTRKESARLFYEILVLKSTGFVDVEQKEAYGDIAISKLQKLDQTF
ncbi:hypothetical protein Fmac_029235 [Flemingia macrophylla]|uniref:Uncharacterized protein n=1 Tax=Flemingia macrophylla TaxID=520843 RepID=A0ABD1L9V2_9FABA